MKAIHYNNEFCKDCLAYDMKKKDREEICKQCEIYKQEERKNNERKGSKYNKER